ncbi:MAG: NADH-quinone oxidoreductase subunit NuoG [Acidimicrobiales bacterium]|jgi:NADH-quinone oxidoreductase subunit G
MSDPTVPVADAGGELPVEEIEFTLDGRTVRARKGEMLIAAAERAGTFIPRFCYHPRMKPVGVCRMCLVEVSGPRGATLMPSCFIEAAPGMEVVTDSDKVTKAQDGVLEFLLINHPLDCPVCDKGGECPLQDQTLAYGPGETRFVEEKRHFEKPIPISELVLLDRERCIQCSRCTRFADEVAGEAQIDFIGRGEQIQVGIFPELPFSSYFSGNTVQICPVGALTATPYRFAARPWDLDQVESTCTTCSVGCRVAVQSSTNRLTRLLGIDIDPVNRGWLCDKGRFAADAVNSDDRLCEPMVRKDGSLVAVSWHEALDAVAEGLRAAIADGGPGSIGVVGGARLANEGAYAWARVAKSVLGTDSVDAQLGDGLPAEVVLGLPRATIDQAASASTVILLTGDVREELPVLFLRLRAAAVDGDLSIVELSPQATSLTSHTEISLRYGPGDAAALVDALVSGGTPPAGTDAAALADARRLVGQGPVVVVVGRPSLAEDGELVADAAQKLAAALPEARFLPALRRGNVLGALDMGLAPGILPGRVSLEEGRSWFEEAWGTVPAARGRGTADILAAAAGDQAEGAPVTALVLLGADPLTDFPDRRLAVRALERAGFVVAVATAPGAALDHADVVLPAAEAHERPGTTTNIEGRVSRLGQKLVPPGQAWPDWMIAGELAVHLGHDLGYDSVGTVWDEIERVAPAYRGITRSVLDARGAADGVVAPLRVDPVTLARRSAPLDPIAVPGVESVERQGTGLQAGLAASPNAGAVIGLEEHADGTGPARPAVLSDPAEFDVPHVAPADGYSVRLVASRVLYDGGSAVGAVPSLAGLVATGALRANPHDLDDLGVAAGGHVRLRSATATTVVPVEPDPSLPRKVVAADFNVPLGETTVADLIDRAFPVVDLRMETP